MLGVRIVDYLQILMLADIFSVVCTVKNVGANALLYPALALGLGLRLEIQLNANRNPNPKVHNPNPNPNHFGVNLNVHSQLPMHIPNRKNLYNFFSLIYPGNKLSKSYENMKISERCKSSCTSPFLFK